ncbi:MAG: hypothetical protein CSB55_03550 [Candidatus Cloacimonadota bacterium]|nr:MAG: hypothetical protein CSB55_03550 [Candidatus Cloacimonadota bacterium]
MKILILNYEYPPAGGGAGNQTKLLAEEFVGKGHDALVVSSHFKGMPFFEIVDGLKIIRVPAFRKHKSKSSLLQMAIYLTAAKLPFFILCLFWKPDVILSFFLMPTSILAVTGKMFFGIPCIVSLRGGDVPSHMPGNTGGYNLLFKKIADFIVRKADMFTSVGSALSETAENDFPGIKNKLRTIRNGIRVKQRYRRKYDKINFIFLGRLSPEKRVYELIEYMHEIDFDFNFYIIGDGSERSRITALLNKIKDSRIRYCGWLDKKEAFALLKKSHFMLMNSEVEGLSVSALEANSFGTPIISARCKGMNEFIVPGRNGFLFDNAEEFAKIINKVVNFTPEEYDDLSRNSQNVMKKEFDISVKAEEYLDLFEEVTR